MGSIFISYRRADAAGHAQNLHDRLSGWFDAEKELFFDGANIDSGQDFPQRLTDAVDAAAVVLVLIGPGWLDEINRRSSNPEVDFVRLEVEQALQRLQAGQDLCVIPVLLGGGPMSAVSALAEPLQTGIGSLCRLDAHAFQGKQDDWEAQLVRLRALIAAQPNAPRERYRDRSGRPRPWRVIDHALSASFQDPNGLLEALCTQLQGSGGVAAIVGAGGANAAALHGMGGIGKTQLALAYSYAHRGDYAGVWWFRAETGFGQAEGDAASLNDALQQQDALAACAAAGVAVPDGEVPSQVFKRWLLDQAAPWLLVFDNADDPRALRPHLPGPGPHHVIITSRRPDWGGVANTLELATWTPDQGAAFLIERLNGAAPLHDARTVSQALGGLPLALEQAASYIEARSSTLAQYLSLWTTESKRLMDASAAATGYELTVGATLSLAFVHLSMAAQQLLRLLAFAAPEPFPERFFIEAQESLPAELRTAAADPLCWGDAAGELKRYALAGRGEVPSLDREWRAGGAAPDGALTELSLTVHRLTQQVVRNQLTIGQHDDHAALLRLVLDACPSDRHNPCTWPRLAALFPHAVSLVGLRPSMQNSQTELDAHNSLLLDHCAVFLVFALALYPQARSMFEQALAIDLRVHGDEHPDTLTSMNNLAATLRAQGDLMSARDLEEHVLAVRRRVLGDDHPDTLTSMNNLAGTLRAQGDLAGARALEEPALAARRRVQGEEHPDTLNAMNNLAATLGAQGDIAGARVLEEHTLAVRRRLLGDEHPDTLTSMSNLAATLGDHGDLAGARALQELALAGRRRVLGEEHPNTLTSMSNLAATLSAQGELAGARDLQERTLAVNRRVLGEEHPDTLASMNNLAATLGNQGDLVGTWSLQEQALAARRNVLGDQHPDTLTSMNNLAITDWQLGDRETALDLMAQAAHGRAAKLGPDHPHTKASTDAVAQMLGAGRQRGDRETPEAVPTSSLLRRVLLWLGIGASSKGGSAGPRGMGD